MTKQKKKGKLRVGRLFLLLLILTAIAFACIKFIDIPIMSITIKGNSILTDQEVLEQASLEDYPSFLSTFTFNVRKDLEKNPYIKKAVVTPGLLNFKINITEEKVLFINKETNEKVTANSKVKDDKLVCVPYLINKVPDKKYNHFIKQMGKINQNILCKMSEIKYDPNDIDEDRYFVYMNDGNTVYLTVNKFSKINKYDSILENVGKQNGTIYLDYGDYFEVK